MVNAARIHGLTDIRGQGGYVVAPPSIHPSGDLYRWIMHKGFQFGGGSTLPPFPVKQLQSRVVVRPDGQIVGVEKHRPVGSGKGGRHDVLLRYCGALRKYHLPYEEILLDLMSINQTFNPPLPDDEVVKMAAYYTKNQELEPRKSMSIGATFIELEGWAMNHGGRKLGFGIYELDRALGGGMHQGETLS